MFMKLIFITQKVDYDDDVLGIYHEWIKELSFSCETIDVICLFQGAHHLPDNVRVHSLGKENGTSRVKYLVRLYRLAFRLLWKRDVMLVHMNDIYLVLLAPLIAVSRIKTALFYAHKSKGVVLRTATRIADKIISYTPQSFPLRTPKLAVLAPSVNDARFFMPEDSRERNPYEIIFAGRLSVSKNIFALVELMQLLVQQDARFHLTLVGKTSNSNDEEYLALVQQKISERGLDSAISFAGSVPNKDLPAYYQRSGFFVNFSETGGVDKTHFEALACGALMVSAQSAIQEFLPADAQKLVQKTPQDFSQIITYYIQYPEERMHLARALSEKVRNQFNLKKSMKHLGEMLAQIS